MEHNYVTWILFNKSWFACSVAQTIKNKQIKGTF
jgi:hypothetical protein